MASEDEDIDKLKLPAAVKLAKVKNISKIFSSETTEPISTKLC
jgi:hypothetical protein